MKDASLWKNKNVSVTVQAARGVALRERQVTALGRVIPAAVNNSNLLRSWKQAVSDVESALRYRGSNLCYMLPYVFGCHSVLLTGRLFHFQDEVWLCSLKKISMSYS